LPSAWNPPFPKKVQGAKGEDGAKSSRFQDHAVIIPTHPFKFAEFWSFMIERETHQMGGISMTAE